MKQLYGEWVTKFEDEQRAYFMCYIQTRNGVETSTVSVKANTNNADSLEELIASFPLSKDTDVNILKHHVRVDSLRGLGTDYPDYGIVAYVGDNNMDKPFARIKMIDGSYKFVSHPQVNLMVKRYR